VAASPRPPSWAIEHSEFNTGDRVCAPTPVGAGTGQAGGPAVGGRAYARMWEGVLTGRLRCGNLYYVFDPVIVSSCRNGFYGF
jgi:hypothetical protein